MKNPLLIPCTSLVVYEDPETEQNLQTQIEKIKTDINYLRDALDKEQEFRDTMFGELNPSLYEEIAKLDALTARHEAYLHEAKSQVTEGTFRPDLLDDEDFIGCGSDKDFIEGTGSQEPDLGGRETRKACARLFKKISNLCHPDKNGGSTILTDTFHTAYGAYKSNDLETLESLWVTLQDSKSKIKSRSSKAKERLLLLLSEYKKVYASVERDWRDFMQTEDALITSIYRKSGTGPATDAYRRMILLSIGEFEKAIENIRAASSNRSVYDDIDTSFQSEGDGDGDDDWDWDLNES